MSCELALVFGRPCDLPECAVSANPEVSCDPSLAYQKTYRELGADYYDRRHTERLTRRAVQTLEQQGYRVTLERAA